MDADFDLEANFTSRYMSLDEEIRTNSSHVFNSLDDTWGEEIRGMIVKCTYRGGDCADEKWASF